MSVLELIAALILVVNVWLCVKENVWGWPVGIVGVAIYVYIYARERFYSNAALQIVFIILALYGWYEWLHGGDNRTEREVSRASRRAWIYVVAVGLGGAYLVGFLLRNHADPVMLYWDSSTMSFSLGAQWMLTRKILENWLIWIAVDVVYVGMFLYTGLYPTAGLYAVFIVLAWRGYVEWKRSMHAAAAV